MEPLQLAYTVLAAAAVSHLCWIYWIQSKGVIPYKKHILNSLLRMTANCCLVLHDSGNIAMLLWWILDVWVIISSARGILRQKEEAKNKAPSY